MRGRKTVMSAAESGERSRPDSGRVGRFAAASQGAYGPSHRRRNDASAKCSDSGRSGCWVSPAGSCPWRTRSKGPDPLQGTLYRQLAGSPRRRQGTVRPAELRRLGQSCMIVPSASRASYANRSRLSSFDTRRVAQTARGRSLVGINVILAQSGTRGRCIGRQQTMG